MTNDEARRIVELILADDSHDYVGRLGENLVALDGDFTADELEAIAIWMRDPKGVTGITS